MGAYLFFRFLHGGLLKGGLKIFSGSRSFPIEIFLAIDRFFDASDAGNRIFFYGTC